jgi:hypothetical protein
MWLRTVDRSLLLQGWQVSTSIHPSIHSFKHLSIHPWQVSTSIHPSIHPSIQSFIH